jgi:hypothetical protein
VVNLPFSRFAKYQNQAKATSQGRLWERPTVGANSLPLRTKAEVGSRPGLARQTSSSDTRARGLIGASPGSRLAAREKRTAQT